jgi:hypothetical protein
MLSGCRHRIASCRQLPCTRRTTNLIGARVPPYGTTYSTPAAPWQQQQRIAAVSNGGVTFEGRETDQIREVIVSDCRRAGACLLLHTVGDSITHPLCP